MKARAFLIFCAVGLIPVALGYGAKPSFTLDALFGIKVDTTNLTHIMRAVMGLYLGTVVFWLCGAFKRSMAGAALAACAVYVLGFAAGRILSFLLDGLPHWFRQRVWHCDRGPHESDWRTGAIHLRGEPGAVLRRL